MRNNTHVTAGKPIPNWLQSISGVSAVNLLVTFYDVNGRKEHMLFFCSVLETTQDFLFKLLKNFYRDFKWLSC
jgi:hypothetical protein